MLNETFLRRFKELDESFGDLSYKQGPYESVPDDTWQQWGTSAQSLIRASFGESSPHYTNFVKSYEKCHGLKRRVKTLHSIFLSAKEDFEGGYVFNIELTISGEIFGDFVLLAREALANGHKKVAAVIACAALEDTLKRFALINRLEVEGKTMAEVVNALKSGGFVQGAQKTLLDKMPQIRNMAMHAEWDKLSEPDISSVIGFVEQFLLSNFN